MTDKTVGLMEFLATNNTPEYNYRKAAEECAELSLILLQKLNHGDGEHKIDDQKVIDEIGDVFLRVGVICGLFDMDKVAKRLDYKNEKIQGWIAIKKYTNY